MNAKQIFSFFERDGVTKCDISLNGVEVGVLGEFRYLGGKFSNFKGGIVEVESRFLQGREIGGALKALVNGGSLSVEFARSFYGGVLAPPLICRCDSQKICQYT